MSQVVPAYPWGEVTLHVPNRQAVEEATTEVAGAVVEVGVAPPAVETAATVVEVAGGAPLFELDEQAPTIATNGTAAAKANL